MEDRGCGPNCPAEEFARLLGEAKSELVAALCDKTELEQQLQALQQSHCSDDQTVRLEQQLHTLQQSTTAERIRQLEEQVARLEEQVNDSKRSLKAAELREESTLQLLQATNRQLQIETIGSQNEPTQCEEGSTSRFCSEDKTTLPEEHLRMSDMLMQAKADLAAAISAKENAISMLKKAEKHIQQSDSEHKSVQTAMKLYKETKRQLDESHENIERLTSERNLLSIQVAVAKRELCRLKNIDPVKEDFLSEFEARLNSIVREESVNWKQSEHTTEFEKQIASIVSVLDIETAIKMISNLKSELIAVQIERDELQQSIDRRIEEELKELKEKNMKLQEEIASIGSSSRNPSISTPNASISTNSDASSQSVMRSYLDVKLALAEATSGKEALAKKLRVAEVNADSFKRQVQSKSDEIVRLKLELQKVQNELATKEAAEAVQKASLSENGEIPDHHENEHENDGRVMDRFVPISVVYGLERSLAEANRTIADLRCVHDDVADERENLSRQLDELLRQKAEDNERAKSNLEFQDKIMTSSIRSLASKLFSTKREEKALRKSLSTEQLHLMAKHAEEEEEEDDLFIPVLLIENDQKSVPLVSKQQAAQLAAALPLRFQFTDWQLIYGASHDGFSLSALLRAVCDAGPTILLVRDADDRVFGGFAPVSWQESSSYFGNGETFVFTFALKQNLESKLESKPEPKGENSNSNSPTLQSANAFPQPNNPPRTGSAAVFDSYFRNEHDDESTEFEKIEKSAEPTLVKYPWSRQNDLFLYARKDMLAFGGGGNFALWIAGDLQSGGSGICETFGNPCLASKDLFDVVDIQIWAMDAFIQAKH